MIIPSSAPTPIIPPHGQVAIPPVKKTEPENKTRQDFNSDDSPDQTRQSEKADQAQDDGQNSGTVQVSTGRQATGSGQPDKPGLEQAITPEERSEIAQLAKRDREVRSHEAAHKGAAGRYAGSVQLEYQRGPDGKLYAVSGEVSIDSSKPKDPEAALRKAQTIQRAALAPANPSNQDRAVAAQAAQIAAQARVELQLENAQQGSPDGSDKENAKVHPVSSAYQANSTSDEGKQQQVDIVI